MIVLLKLLSGKIDSLIVGEVRKKNFTLFQCTEMSWCHTNSPKYQHLTTKNDTY